MTEQRYRFVVGSAEEAVKVLHERLGANARVISVRQVEGQGLARFLKSPKLEVIAEVAEAAQDTSVARGDSACFPSAEADVHGADARPALSLESTAPIDSLPGAGEEMLTRLIRAAGISAPVLARLKSAPGWGEIERLPAGIALGRVAGLLHAEFAKIPKRPLGERVAFVGGPGAGKTTALCKLLSSDVFLHQRPGVVLKLDLDSANPSDGLGVFCEALGVACVRSVWDLPALGADTRLYVDVPGLSLSDQPQFDQLADELAPLDLTSRILVVNAAYETAVIQRFGKFGERLGCTHLVLTHVDELLHWGKLWDVLLGSRLTPLFLSTGQNVAGDLEENVVPTLLARTFPMLGREAANDVVAT